MTGSHETNIEMLISGDLGQGAIKVCGYFHGVSHQFIVTRALVGKAAVEVDSQQYPNYSYRVAQ